ncbi:MAG TPA: hypothetical protein VFV08_04415, partial [Puia sp.]|nr:hypothetical protein [Puia sp.]
KMTKRQINWHSTLMEYNLQWEYIPGSKMIQSDALSRRFDHLEGQKEQDHNVMPPLITPERIIALVRIQSNLLSLEDQFNQEMKNDAFGINIVEALAASKTPIHSEFDNWEQ